jgi:4-carboxymuconolactone decarboxylase
MPFLSHEYEDLHIQNTNDSSVPLAKNNMDTSVHQTLYAQGLEMRRKVVGEDYVANALEKGSGDFMRPLQQFATVFTFPALLLCPV